MAFNPAADTSQSRASRSPASAADRKQQARLRTLVRRAMQEDRARDSVRALCVLWSALQARGHQLGIHPLKQRSRRNGRGDIDWQYRDGHDSRLRYLYRHSEYAPRRAATEIRRMARGLTARGHAGAAADALEALLGEALFTSGGVFHAS